MRMSELDAFQKLIAPYFDGVTRPPLKLPALTTSHDFETTIKGVFVVVSYTTKWDRLECVDEIDYTSIKVFVDGTDITPLLPNETVNGLRHEIEADWERIGMESKDDFR